MKITKYIFFFYVVGFLGSALHCYPASYRRLLVGDKTIDVIGHVTIEQEIDVSEQKESENSCEEKLCAVIQTLDLDTVIKRTLLWAIPFVDASHIPVALGTSVFLWDQGLSFRDQNFSNVLFENIDMRSLFVSAVIDRLYYRKVYDKKNTFKMLINNIDAKEKEFRDTACIRLLYEGYSQSSMDEFACKLNELSTLILSNKDKFMVARESISKNIYDSCIKLASLIIEQLELLSGEFEQKDMTVDEWLNSTSLEDATRIHSLLHRWACVAPVVLQGLIAATLSSSDHIIINASIAHAVIIAACIREWSDGIEHLVIEAQWPANMRPSWTPIPLDNVDWVMVAQKPSFQEATFLQPSASFDSYYGVPQFLALIN